MKRLPTSPDPEDHPHRCGLYPAQWKSGRVVTTKAASKRFEVKAEDAGAPVTRNVASAAEALRLARLYSGAGSDVYVRDRSRRRAYLSEATLMQLAQEEADA